MQSDGNEVLGAYSAEVAIPHEYTVKNGSVTIGLYTGSAAEVVIPSEIEGYPVTAIGRRAFHNCTSLESVSIAEGVTSIGIGAFYYLANPSTVTVSTQDQYDLLAGNGSYISTDRTEVVLAEPVLEVGDYVKRLYKDILGNGEPTDFQVSYWAERIKGGRPVASVVRGMCESDAFANAGYSDEQKVAALYAAMLGIYDPTSYQLDYWEARLATGEALASVIDGFAASEVFAEQAELYGLSA